MGEKLAEILEKLSMCAEEDAGKIVAENLVGIDGMLIHGDEE
ncbi:hypothetical protein HCR_22980 (plasmid) [Hydrogenimonas cancrithermarum]|uniref:Uncharacterized protein n=1 Tax=Hydrogenimonas cancrithermarum TaxID=2993563 RepID=A0ABN6WXE4_9BACT|nr:hypothetical protein HCR_22980 [Hydrogenimonas cancrithermarum]